MVIKTWLLIAKYSNTIIPIPFSPTQKHPCIPEELLLLTHRQFLAIQQAPMMKKGYVNAYPRISGLGNYSNKTAIEKHVELNRKFLRYQSL